MTTAKKTMTTAKDQKYFTSLKKWECKSENHFKSGSKNISFLTTIHAVSGLTSSEQKLFFLQIIIQGHSWEWATRLKAVLLNKGRTTDRPGYKAFVNRDKIYCIVKITRMYISKQSEWQKVFKGTFLAFQKLHKLNT